MKIVSKAIDFAIYTSIVFTTAIFIISPSIETGKSLALCISAAIIKNEQNGKGE